MTIRTAVIGFGTAGRVFHAPLVEAESRFTLAAVVTSSPERAAAVRERHPGAAVLPGVDELIERAGEFDLVVVGSPNETHAPLALRAIGAGLNVVIDKPVAVTAREGRQVAEAARAAGVVLSVFQNRRWDGDFLTLRALLERGELGTVHQFESAFEWWKPRVGQRRKDLAPQDAGGGILYDLGPHLIDQAVQLFGPVREVHAELDTRRPGSPSDDDSFVSLLHAGGVRSRLWMSAVAPSARPRFRVTGSEGVFVSQGLDPQEQHSKAGLRPLDQGYGVHEDGRTATVLTPDGGSRPVPLEPGEHLRFYRLLGDALTGGAPVPVDPDDPIAVLELIERAVARGNRAVS
ncbi:Gfo/Idh/MocA family oxidoreductase [Kineosporia sp. J2-2]|uniref:Gfo/Idh/MocA family oxidoreductase n=1 Tax=Kineosporia corallincola TaxID=2835133 RepID=A0ABS5TBX6_9ACTN|nr:Gfo/Idh/MocA family oxidoreductase [Kineosporia corallincola]MBT0768546.1 Gfo/Idh/MocA family oxidoreductase [Kineosporia corallincola]